MTERLNLLEEYKELYEITKRDKDKFMEIILQMKDNMEIMRDTIVSITDVVSDLKKDNRRLRTELSLVRNQYEFQTIQNNTLLNTYNSEPNIINDPSLNFPLEVRESEM